MGKLTPENEMAIQQFTGFNLAYQGFSADNLASSMGLDADEWELLKPEMLWLDYRIVAALDDYFAAEEEHPND